MRRSNVKIAARIESVADARDLAARRLPKGIFQVFGAGSGSNASRRAALVSRGGDS
jgi:hypothetical protein